MLSQKHWSWAAYEEQRWLVKSSTSISYITISNNSHTTSTVNFSNLIYTNHIVERETERKKRYARDASYSLFM